MERSDVVLHPHAMARLVERGATEAEVVTTVVSGKRVPAKHGRLGFRKDFAFNGVWLGNAYATKQIEAYAVEEGGKWLVISFITRYF